MTPCPRRNPPRSAGHSDPNELEEPSKQGTPAPSDAGLPDAPVPVPAPAKYTEEDL